MTCPEKYKNLGLQSFGEQKYVTTEMLRQFCMNDAYLKRQVDQLEYLTPPAVRKRFNPIPIDKNRSFGYEQKTNGEIIFDTETAKNYTIDFFDESVIDLAKTTAELESKLDDSGTIVKQYKVPTVKTCTGIKRTTRNYSPWTIRDENGNIISDDMTCNEFWYVGFDRNRTYETRPNWLANMLNGEIPGISRAQTFKAKSSGVLESVTLNLKGGTNTGMPLIVQIRKTVLRDGVYVPVDSDQPHLAYESVKFSNTDPGVMSVTFNNPPTLQEGLTYAIVLLSPLSHPTNCYWIGGWNRHCHADVYEDGNAFYSWNCGYTWIRYGKDDVETGEEVAYHAGKYAPQDFAFQCSIREDKCETKYDTSKDFYVYLNPIYSNPIKSVRISAEDKGDTAGDDYSITYEVSQDADEWKSVKPNTKFNFTPDSDGEYNHVLFIRAKLTTNDEANTPLLQSLAIALETTLPREMYIRTIQYAPPLTGILSASVWGRIRAPFTEEETVECTAEIIRDREVMEHFSIIEPLDIVNYTYLDEIDPAKVVGKSESIIRKYLTDNPSIVEALQEHNIYILDYFTEIKLINSPAYPLVSLRLQPTLRGIITQEYGEWHDYTVDYTEDIIKFKENTLEDMPKGALTVTYNPLFIDGLTNEEVGSTNGLVLDYFLEEFIITEEDIETRTLPLRATPVDPIRKVTIIRDSEDDDSEDNIELTEDVEYTVDYSQKQVQFNVIYSDEESTALAVGDLIRIVYTPNLDDCALSIGYHAKRTNTNKKCTIHHNWIEYKA